MPADLIDLKAFFFSAKRVTDKVDPATRRVLSRFGAFVRRRAKSSLKYKDGPAPPGKPPHVHRSTGFTKKGKGGKPGQPSSPLRELVYFAFEPSDKSVVIGPAIGGSRSGAPKTLEEGGTAVVDGKTVAVRPRPTMKPAFALELVKAADGYRDTVKE